MTEPQAWIVWDSRKARRFRRAMKKAQKNGLRVFVFEGHDFMLSFASYLSTHLIDKFGIKD